MKKIILPITRVKKYLVRIALFSILAIILMMGLSLLADWNQQRLDKEYEKKLANNQNIKLLLESYEKKQQKKSSTSEVNDSDYQCDAIKEDYQAALQEANDNIETANQTIEEANEIIDDLNYTIEIAKADTWLSYDEMGWALESLDTGEGDFSTIDTIDDPH